MKSKNKQIKAQARRPYVRPMLKKGPALGKVVAEPSPSYGTLE